MSGRSSSTAISITHGSPRSSTYSISSRSSHEFETMGYEERSSYSLRVPVTEAQAKYDSNDRINQVDRGGVSVINHKKRISEPMAPTSNEAIGTGYYR